MFSMEWPPKSGKMREFPEVDAGGLYSLPAALEKRSRDRISIAWLAEKIGVSVPKPQDRRSPNSPEQHALF